MDTRIIECGSLDSLQDKHDDDRPMFELTTDGPGPLYVRRQFLRFVSIGTAGLALPIALGGLPVPGHAAGYGGSRYERLMQLASILAMLKTLMLLQQEWQVREPTEGRVRVVNPRRNYARGKLALAVVGQGRLGEDDIEDLAVDEYELPPRHYTDFQFTNGPSGRSPGRKAFAAATARDTRTAPMTVYA